MNWLIMSKGIKNTFTIVLLRSIVKIALLSNINDTLKLVMHTICVLSSIISLDLVWGWICVPRLMILCCHVAHRQCLKCCLGEGMDGWWKHFHFGVNWVSCVDINLCLSLSIRKNKKQIDDKSAYLRWLSHKIVNLSRWPYERREKSPNEWLTQ